jgi:hypothetical protein
MHSLFRSGVEAFQIDAPEACRQARNAASDDVLIGGHQHGISA